jgi:hypothetical protein
MFRPYVTFLFFVLCTFLRAQDLYIKNPAMDDLKQFHDTAHKFSVKGNDSLLHRYCLNYLVKFFPNIEIGKVSISARHSKKPFRVKPAFMSAWKSPEKRKYRIILSTGMHSPEDTVLPKRLNTAAILGFIARPFGQIHDLSTDGFFDLLGWRLKHLSKKRIMKYEKENEQRLAENGLGYVLLALRVDEENRLNPDNFESNKKKAKKAKQILSKHISSEKIRLLISELPIYVSHQYK